MTQHQARTPTRPSVNISGGTPPGTAFDWDLTFPPPSNPEELAAFNEFNTLITGLPYPPVLADEQVERRKRRFQEASAALDEPSL